MTVTSDNSDLQKQHLDNLIASYTQRTQASKRYAQTYRQFLADKSSLGLGFSSELKEMCYPVVVEKAAGSKLWDIDSNEYVDILMGLGINLFGHNPEFVKKAIAIPSTTVGAAAINRGAAFAESCSTKAGRSNPREPVVASDALINFTKK